jgi:hypothetical protein
MCILHIENYPMGQKTKHYSLMINRARPFEIPSVTIYSLILLKVVKE